MARRKLEDTVVVITGASNGTATGERPHASSPGAGPPWSSPPTGGGAARGSQSMREQAELVIGPLRVSSAPGTGTKTETSIPL